MYQGYLFLAISICITVSAQLLIKRGVLSLGDLDFSISNVFNLIPKIAQNIWLLSGLFLFAVSFFLWLFIISRLKLSIAYPISTSLSFCFIILASWFIFKEQLLPIQILGIIIIIVGIFLVAKF